MTRTVRRAALAALAALAAVAAIIAADLTPPAAAQSEDETTGRIVARRLDDGRVEFGWQPTGGARVLPRQRYFPADATVDRWLRSSPVEVNGAEIGRINARLLSDGRIEFAFTPTDGERITPQARYFPADARVGRWLRSTEIAIGPARAGYVAISAGYDHTCAIRASGEIECWGRNVWQTNTPEGSYTAVSMGVGHSCAIRRTGEIECWGWNETQVLNRETGESEFRYSGQATPPDGSYTAVSAGYNHTCAIRESGAIECWGWNGDGQTNAPEGSFSAVSAGRSHTCAIRASGEIECWGWNGDGQTNAPEGSFTAVSADELRACAIRESGTIKCWGWNKYGESDAPAPEGSYSAVSTGYVHTCAIRRTGEIECWGINGIPYYTEAGMQIDENGQIDAPKGSYNAVSAGYDHACAIRASSGAIECWGSNDHGQATPPTD